MGAIEGLGNTHDVVYPADDVYVSLRNARGVTFYVHEVDGATQATITFGTTASGGSTSTPDSIDHFYGKSSDTAGGVWHRTAVSPASETVTAADGTEDLIAIYVSGDMCPAGKSFVKCTADGSATVTAVFDGLSERRTPANLPSRLA